MEYMELKERNRVALIQEVRAGGARLKGRPLAFWFDLTGRCSLKCKHCAYQVYGRLSDGDVVEEVYQRVMEEVMPSAYVCHLGGTNYGEMTISRNFHRFLQDCQKYQVKINLTSNGTCIKDEWLDDLLGVLQVIGFSMEGMGEQFENTRSFPWERFRANVEKVCQARTARGVEFLVEWRYCAHAENIHQLPEIIRLAHEMGVIVKIPEDFNTGTWAPQDGSAGSGKGGRRTVPLHRCFLAWQACSINELGDVRVCDRYWRKMGNIRGRAFEAVWNGWRYRRLRRNVNARTNKLCYSCRQPAFDSDDSMAAYQLAPSLKQVVKGVARGLVRRRPRYEYRGELACDYTPLDQHP